MYISIIRNLIFYFIVLYYIGNGLLYFEYINGFVLIKNNKNNIIK